MDKTKTVPVVEAKDTKSVEEAKAETPEKTPEVKKEATIGEQLGMEKKVESKPQTKTVPEATFLEMKNEFKALKKSVEEGNKAKAEVAGDVSEIAKKYDIKPEFLNELVGAIQDKTKKEFDAELQDKLKPLKDKEQSEKIESAFDKAYTKALENAPEFKDVVNREVIKALSLNPTNASKTFNQIMEESYGHLITGKRSLDPTGGPSPRETTTKVDFARAEKDTAYFEEVMANPKLKEEYNEGITGRLSIHM